MDANQIIFKGESFPIPQHDSGVLEVCERLNIVSSRCKAGRCGACQIKLISGEVEAYQPMLALIPREKREGAILPCVAKAKTTIEVESWY